MFQKFAILFISFLALCNLSNAGPAYAFRVTFKDKNGTLTFADSLQYLSPKALMRRAKQNIMLDSSDLPVVKSYIDSVVVKSNAVMVHNVSKWFNQVVVITYDSLKGANCSSLPMVESVKLIARYNNGIFKNSQINDSKFDNEVVNSNKTTGTSAYYGLTFQQVNMLGLDCLHDLGYRGEDMDIAVFDVNFRYTDVCSAFDSLRLQNRIKDVYNFVKDTNYVFSQAINNDHGMNVLGCMASLIPSVNIGTSPYGNYYLYNTEDNYSEQPIEEDNWLSAAERADSIGVYLVNSSLGYNNFDAPFTNTSSYKYADLTGSKTLIAKAANKLVSKGIILVQAQGNEGAAAWHYMLTPADADSAFSVGSVDGSGIWASSGYGPNFSGQIKPDGCALGKGTSLIGGNCLVGSSNGSSFASPVMCGAIACLWQALPTKTNWEIRQLVKMSSSQYLNPNNTTGYGIPNFCSAYNIALGTSDIKHIEYQFTTFPNPTQGEFKVTCFNNNIKEFYYSVYDMQGKCVYKDNKKYFNSFTSSALNNMAKGEYILLLTTAEKTYSTKIIKN